MTIEKEPKRGSRTRQLAWQPNDPACVEQFKWLLGDGFFNHGGLLRIETVDGIVEMQAGQRLTVEVSVEGVCGAAEL